MLKSLKETGRRFAALKRLIAAFLSTYFTGLFLQGTSTTVYAGEKDSPTAFSKYVDDSADPYTLARIFNRFVGPLQSVGAVILVIACIVCGIRIGAAAMTGDPRARTSSLLGIAWIIVGAVVCVNARGIVGMAVSLSKSNG